MSKNYREMAIILEGQVGSSLRKSAVAAVQQLQQIDKQVRQLGTVKGKMEAFRDMRKQLLESERALRAAQERVQKLKREGAGAANATKEQKRAFQDAVREAQRLHGQVEKQRTSVGRVRTELQKSGVDTKKFRSEVARVTEELAKAESNAEELRQAMANQQAFDKSLADARTQVDQLRGGMVDAAAAAYGIFQAIRKPLEKSIEFEDAMAEVLKFVDFDTPQQFNQMSNDIMKLSENMRMTSSEIATLVAFGAQLQLPRQELVGFARDAGMMGVAFGSTADEAGKTMATWRASMGLTQEQAVTLADQVNYLSNQTGALAPEISEVLSRVGSLGKVAGIASGGIAAMGTTLLKAGISEEVASTGLKNFMLGMTAGESATKKQQEAFKTLGFETKILAKRMQTDAQGAILDVLAALEKMPKSEQLALLNQMFGKESIGAIAPLLTMLPQLQENFAAVGDKTKYSGSMLDEFNKQNSTTSALQDKTGNSIARLNTLLGDELKGSWQAILSVTQSLASKTADLITKYPALGQVMAGATTAAIIFMGTMVLVKAAMFVGAFIKSGWLDMVNIFNKLRQATLLQAVASKLVAAAQWLWNASLYGCPVMWIIAGIIALIAVIYLLVKHWDKVKAAGTAAWNWITKGAMQAWEWIKKHWPLIVSILGGPVGAAVAFIITHWDKIKDGFGAIIDWFKSVGSKFTQAITKPFSDAVQYIQKQWDAVKSIFTGGTKSGAEKAKVAGLSSPARNAVGNIITSPTLSWVAENGPEAIIPLRNNRDRALSLWEQTGQALGVGGRGHGGMTVTFAPTITITGNASRSEVEAGMRTAYDEFRRLMAQYQDEQRRRVMA